MMKRIVAALLVLVLALGCVFALAETAATEESTTTEAAVVEGKTRYIAAGKGLNIRAAADLEAEVIATPDFNYSVKVIGEEGKWSHVIYESNDETYEGYCWTAYLSDHKIVVKHSSGETEYKNPHYGKTWVKELQRWLTTSELQEHETKMRDDPLYWEHVN